MIAYLKYIFGIVFIENILRIARQANDLNPGCNQHNFAIPAGNSNLEIAPRIILVTKDSNNQNMRKLCYKQSQNNYCFCYSFANALYYRGLKNESRIVANFAEEWSNMDNVSQLKKTWLVY